MTVGMELSWGGPGGGDNNEDIYGAAWGVVTAACVGMGGVMGSPGIRSFLR